MSNKITIYLGLILFLVLVTFPFWYTLGAGRQVEMPKLEMPEGECIEPQMIARHMDLLDQWRNAVVRDGVKEPYVSSSGKEYTMSLTGTCLGCHGDREAFCTRCHEYANVVPFQPAPDDGTPPGIRCWDCHVQPQQAESPDAGQQNTEPKGD